MRKPASTPGRTLVMMSLFLFCVLWAVWFFGYRYFLIWLEGFSYFSTLPDFLAQHKDMPYGLLSYVGSFLHQFYAVPAAGAAIQAFIGTWIVICTGTALIRVFDDPEDALWLSLIPLPFFIFIQFWDLRMLNSVLWMMIVTSALLIVLVVTVIKRPGWKMPKFFCLKPLNAVMLILVSALSVYMLLFMDPRNKVHEEQVHLEYLGENHDWNEILNTVSPADAKSDDLKKRYVMLALSETGILADYAFMYGLSSSEDFIFYESINTLCLNYNALFYRCSGIHNAAIHQLYQLGVQSKFGVSFSTLRNLADIYIELKDYDLAKKYVDILSHSACHGKWVKERMAELEKIRDSKSEYEIDENKATISNFKHTISSMAVKYPENQKYADLLLCSLLADREMEGFMTLIREICKVQYPEGTGLPELYEEALVMYSKIDPHALDGFEISGKTRAGYDDYLDMMSVGRGSQALRKYSDTYWAYSYL